MTALAEVLRRSQRAAIVGELLETFESRQERLELIAQLKNADLISATTADMLVESYCMEGA